MRRYLYFIAGLLFLLPAHSASTVGIRAISREAQLALTNETTAGILTGLGAVNKAGDTMTGALVAPELTVTSNAYYSALQATNVTFLVPPLEVPVNAVREGAVWGETVTTSDVVPAPSTLYRGGGRTALIELVSDGMSNVYFPTGIWNLYAGYDTVGGRYTTALAISDDLTIQGNGRGTVLDFGRRGNTAQADLQIELELREGTLTFKDMTISNFNYLVGLSRDYTPITSRRKIRFENVKLSGQRIVGDFDPEGDSIDIRRTNLFTSATWTAGAGWAASGGTNWTYTQPAALTISTIGRTNYVNTYETTAAHGLAVGDWVVVDCSNDTFDQSTPGRVTAVPNSTQFSVYDNIETAVANTAATGDVYVLGKLKIEHDMTIEPGYLIKTRVPIEVGGGAAATGVYLYAGGTLLPRWAHADKMTLVDVQRTTAGSDYTQANVPGHNYQVGDRVVINGSINEFYQENIFTVQGNDSSGRVRMTPAPPATLAETGTLTVQYARQEISSITRAAYNNNTATVTITCTAHGMSVGQTFTIISSDADLATYTNKVYQIWTVPTANTFTTTEYVTGLTVSTITPDDDSTYFYQVPIERRVQMHGIDSEIYLIPDYNFTGTIGVSAVYVPDKVDFEMVNCEWHIGTNWIQNARDGLAINRSLGRTLIRDSKFSGGNQMLYIGRADAIAAQWNSGDYYESIVIDNCDFNGIGNSEQFDTRGLYLFGGNILVQNSRFNSIGQNAYSIKPNKQALYINSSRATFRDCIFAQSAAPNLIYVKVGGLAAQTGRLVSDSGNPVNYGILFDQCHWIGDNSHVTTLINIDGKPVDVTVRGGEAVNFPLLYEAFNISGNYTGFNLYDFTFRQSPKILNVIKATGYQTRIDARNVKVFDSMDMVDAFWLYAPLEFRCRDFYVDNRTFSRSPFTYLLDVTAVSGYNTSEINITGARINTSDFAATALINFPASYTATNIIAFDNSIGGTETTIVNEATATITKKLVGPASPMFFGSIAAAASSPLNLQNGVMFLSNNIPHIKLNAGVSVLNTTP